MAIDWTSLRHAYGDASDVPRLLGQIESADGAARSEAIAELWSALCHQETVYSASAAAVPFLFAAARGPQLNEDQRESLLFLVVYIGRGEDGLWEGYTSREEMLESRRAVAEIAADVVRWSSTQDAAAQAAAIGLCAYFPAAAEAAGVELARLGGDAADPRLAAARGLAVKIARGDALDDADVRAAARTDEEALDLHDALGDVAVERRARSVILELLQRGS